MSNLLSSDWHWMIWCYSSGDMGIVTFNSPLSSVPKFRHPKFASTFCGNFKLPYHWTSVCVCQLAFTFHKLKGKACVVSNACTRMDENCTKMSIPIIPSLSKQPNIQTSYQPISPNKPSSQPSCKSPLLIQFVPSFTFNAPRSIAGANAKAAGMMVLKPRSPLASARVA